MPAQASGFEDTATLLGKGDYTTVIEALSVGLDMPELSERDRLAIRFNILLGELGLIATAGKDIEDLKAMIHTIGIAVIEEQCTAAGYPEVAAFCTMAISETTD